MYLAPKSWLTPDVALCPLMCRSLEFLANVCFASELTDPQRGLVPLTVPQLSIYLTCELPSELADP
jgi:hypothetical protein